MSLELVTTPQRVPVSERAILMRLNRKLAAEEKVVKVRRVGARRSNELGRYYVLNYATNFVAALNIDLDGCARHYGVLQPWEEIDAD